MYLTQFVNSVFKSRKTMASLLPLFFEGEVVKGFGRGSRDLGCPTANYPMDVVRSLPQGTKLGVYYGWAQVEAGPVYKMVVNIGWCPIYNNKDLSIETHIMHKFDEDFYGSNLKICIVGYLREEMNFDSLDDLIKTIQNDIKNADEKLEEKDAQLLKTASIFKTP